MWKTLKRGKKKEVNNKKGSHYRRNIQKVNTPKENHFTRKGFCFHHSRLSSISKENLTVVGR